ncbi:MAG: ribosome maturation factor RimP [Nitrospirota bacterium]
MSIPEHGSRSSIDRIQDILSPILWTLGLELVDVVCVGQGSRSVVRVLIDKPGGVTVSDCERAHLAVGPALDVADPFPHAYTLEVSSPGLDRMTIAANKRVGFLTKEDVQVMATDPITRLTPVLAHLAFEIASIY